MSYNQIYKNDLRNSEEIILFYPLGKVPGMRVEILIQPRMEDSRE